MPNYGEFRLDNSQFKQDIEDAKRALNGIGKTAEQNAMSMDSAFKKAGQMAAGYFSIAAAANFVSQLVQVRGEFQKLEVGFTTMLGSKEKSNQLMAQMVDTAMKTPFTLQEVAGGAKQLLAYQVAQEDINKTLLQLGNIASGLGVPMERLIMVYGQVKAKGKLMGDDLRQFTEAGVPMIHELAKSMGVADGEVQKLISSGKVGFPEVQKVIENLTGAGGMFYNLMEAQSKTVTGQLSNLEDAWSKMLNQIGSDNDGMIYGAISGVSSLITNYETVGKILMELIVSYGVYKAALIGLTAIENLRKEMAAVQLSLNSGIVASTITLTAEQELQTISTIQLSTAQKIQAVAAQRAAVAQGELNTAVSANVYVIAAIAVAALGYGIYKLITYQNESEQAQTKLNETIGKTQKEITGETVELDRLFAQLNNSKKGTDEYRIAKDAIFSKYGTYLKNLGDENTALNDQAKAYETIKNSIAAVANAKGFEQATKTAQEDYTNSIIDTKNTIQSILESKFGKDSKLSIDYMVKLNPIIEKGGDVNSIKNEFKKLFDVTNYSGGGPDSSAKVTTTNQLADLLKANAASKQLYDNVVKVAKVKFEQTGTSKSTDSPKEGDKKVIDGVACTFTGGKWVKDVIPMTDEEKTRAKKIAEDKLKLNENISKQETDMLRKNEDDKYKLRQEGIDGMDEGYSKEFAQLKLNHDKKMTELQREAQDEVEKLQKIDDDKWALTAKRDKKGDIIGHNTNKVSLSNEKLAEYTQRGNQEDKNWGKEKQNIVDKLAKEYQSFDDRRREIDKKYNADETAIKANFKGGELISKLAELKSKNKEALQEVNKDQADSAFKNNDLLVSLFDDMAGKSIDDLRKVADQSKELFDYLNGTDIKDITPKFGLSVAELTSLKLGKANMKDIRDQIKSVNDQADQLETGFKKIATAIKNVSEGTSQVNVGKVKVKEGEYLKASGDPKLIEEGNKKIKAGMSDIAEGSEKAKKGMSGVASVFGEVSKYADQAVGLLNAISTEEGDVADQAAKSIGAVMKIAGPVVDSLAKGDYVGAAISLVTGTLTAIFTAEKAHQQALKKLHDEKVAQQKEYNDLLMKQNSLLKNAETIYGTDAFGKSIGYAQVADKTRNASNNAVSALGSATVQTGTHKGGLFGWGGEVSDYSSLTKTYPMLIDGQGKLNKELAQSILDNQTLNESSKKALQTALDYTKDYEDALKSMSDYLNSVFGSLGQDMMTAITDNLNSSQDAMDAFGKSAGKTIEKLMSDIAYSMFFADKFKKMQDQALAIQADGGKTPEQKAAEQTKLLGDFYGGIGGDIKKSQDWLKQNKDLAAKSGFDLWNETNTRQASAKGFASMSQQSADELNGRFTAMQGHTFAISESMKILQVNSAQSLKHLAGIETNTARLESVENNMISLNNSMNSVKSGIDNINLKGIKLQ